MENVPEKVQPYARKITQYVAALVGNYSDRKSKKNSSFSNFKLFSAMGGALSAGAVFGWSSPAQYRLTTQKEYGFEITEEQWSWVGSTITLGGN